MRPRSRACGSTEQVDAGLRRAGIDTWLLDGTQALALLWERLHPAAELTDHEQLLERLADACEIADATTLDEAAEARHRMLEAVCERPAPGSTSARARRGCATATGRWRRRSISRPRRWRPTRRGWRTCSAARCPRRSRFTSRVGVRSREKHRQRRRWQRLRAAVRYKERRDRLVGSDEEDALEEAAVIDAELAAEVGATVYQVGIYCSIRDPRGDAESFERIVKQTCSDFHALTNARVVRGRHLALHGLHRHAAARRRPAAARRRRYAQRNIAHCVALTSSRCGCPDGLILGTADPGGTLERLDPYDRQFATTLTLIVGKGGGGKTVTSILLACRFIAQGGRIYITDRSSTPDDRGDTQRHRPLRHAAVAGPRRPAGAARDRARRGDLPLGRPRRRARPRPEGRVPARAARAADRRGARRRRPRSAPSTPTRRRCSATRSPPSTRGAPTSRRAAARAAADRRAPRPPARAAS